MAYACPVCSEPQVDAEHLANHVAFTAIGGDDAHEEWLDATVPEWGQLGQAELADVVVDHAEETEFPIDVESEEVGGHAHDHDHGAGRSGAVDVPASATPAGDLDEDARDVLEEARELTRQMHEGEGVDDGQEGADETEGDRGGDDSDGDDGDDVVEEPISSTGSDSGDSSDSETQ